MSISVLDKLEKLNTFQKNGKRAPHKPLLLLWTVVQYLNGSKRQIDFNYLEKPMMELLRDFSPFSSKTSVHYPFWRLQNDGIWQLDNHQNCKVTGGDVAVTILRKEKVCGGLFEDEFQRIKSNPEYGMQIVQKILDDNFPDSLHEDILDKVGLNREFEVVKRKKRDPKFRDMILKQYGFQCAVCGMSMFIGNVPIGVEAAHIKWVQAHGANSPDNGMALCAIHHKLFDRGAFRIEPDDYTMKFSKDFSVPRGMSDWLMSFNGQQIKLPFDKLGFPKQDYLEWHRVNVFRG